jgi:hypothetical protein
LGKRGALGRDQLPDALGGQVKQRVHLGSGKRRALGRALHSTKCPAAVITTFMSVSQAESSV